MEGIAHAKPEVRGPGCEDFPLTRGQFEEVAGVGVGLSREITKGVVTEVVMELSDQILRW